MLCVSCFLFATCSKRIVRVKQMTTTVCSSPVRSFTAAPLFPLIGDAGLNCTRRAALGEGPTWDHRQNRLSWVDITHATLHLFDATSNQHSSYALPSSRALWAPITCRPTFLSFAIPCENDCNTFVCGSESCIFLWCPPIGHEEGDGEVATHSISILERVSQPPASHRSGGGGGGQTLGASVAVVRANDAKMDPCGRLFWGTMHIAETEPLGALFCRKSRRCDSPGGPSLHQRHHVVSEKLLDSCVISNGIDWSPSFDVMYFVDSTSQCVVELPYRTEVGFVKKNRDGGGAAKGRIIYRAPAGSFPDGICVDEAGCLWVALWGGGKVVRVDPRRSCPQQRDVAADRPDGSDCGMVVGEVVVPNAPFVTSVCFGGPKLSQLFITTASKGAGGASPSAEGGWGGHVFVANVGVCGLPFHPYPEEGEAAAEGRGINRPGAQMYRSRL